MKVGIFTDSYKPYTSGVVTSISTFKEELNKLGHKKVFGLLIIEQGGQGLVETGGVFNQY
jgi:hypothetical protein